MKARTRNITLALPEPLLRKVKVLAAERHTSVSRLLTETLELLVMGQGAYERARKRSLTRLDDRPDLGTGGRVEWEREDLHAR